MDSPGRICGSGLPISIGSFPGSLKVAKELEHRGFRSLPLPPAHTLAQYRYYESFDRRHRYLGDFSINTPLWLPDWEHSLE